MIREKDNTGIWIKDSRRVSPRTHLCEAVKITEKNLEGRVSFAYANEKEIASQCENCSALYVEEFSAEG